MDLTSPLSRQFPRLERNNFAFRSIGQHALIGDILDVKSHTPFFVGAPPSENVWSYSALPHHFGALAEVRRIAECQGVGVILMTVIESFRINL